MQQHQFSWFTINQNDSADSEWSKSAGTTLSSGSIRTEAGGAYFTGHTTYEPGRIYDLSEPESRLLVRGAQTNPGDLLTFETSNVQQSIRKKYGMK